ncbi:S49 family peptidase [Paenimyroides baculatum]|uniref:Peptidase S49 domain-containing protein n=1 Tax=Paenimyroides baculatum TaxID=2608000 RepID=A0A5M6CHB1_9FLAO|nr:S49 family peptidase [Paenimyroides baculatum]KAA5532795.1 hypothetical protein F0460_13195 [Paenimyroides baculatum]
MIDNLHSLLSGKWYMEPSVINGMLPLLQSVLAGTDFKVSEKYKPAIVLKNGTVVLATYDKWGDLVLPKANEPFVMVNPIKSTIFKYNQACGPTGTKDHQKVLQEYLNDPMCVGIVLDIDSGGGQVSGTAEFYDFLKAAQKPIHTYTDGYLCSAAYYIASATTSITANPRADMIGSIGTMISFVDLTGYYEKQGAKVITEYATKSTAKNKSYRDLLAGNPESYILNELDPITDTFINNVKDARPNVNESVFDGSTYDAEKSLELGLIDTIGQMDTLIQSIFNTKETQNSNNSNLNMKMSNHLRVMAVIGVATALAIDEEKGTYFNEQQLQSMEDALGSVFTVAEKQTLETSLQTANEAKTTAETALQTATIEHANNVQEIATALGLKADATQADITARIAGLSAGHTNPTGTEKPKEDEKGSFDEKASHNQFANQYLNK